MTKNRGSKFREGFAFGAKVTGVTATSVASIFFTGIAGIAAGIFSTNIYIMSVGISIIIIMMILPLVIVTIGRPKEPISTNKLEKELERLRLEQNPGSKQHQFLAGVCKNCGISIDAAYYFRWIDCKKKDGAP